jgi:hypothetical protein
VATATDLLTAAPLHRPQYLATDLRGLLVAHPGVTSDRAPDDAVARCGPWTARRSGNEVVLHRDPAAPAAALPADDPVSGDLDAVRAACAITWSRTDSAGPALRLSGDVPALLQAGA